MKCQVADNYERIGMLKFVIVIIAKYLPLMKADDSFLNRNGTTINK